MQTRGALPAGYAALDSAVEGDKCLFGKKRDPPAEGEIFQVVIEA